MFESTTSTCINSEKEFTIDDLRKSIACIDKIKKKETKKYDIPIFTKLMNKLGWHRKYEILIIDSEKLKTYSLYPLSINIPNRLNNSTR